MESLFSPKTIAVIGVSRTPGKVGREIAANLLKGGFEGQIVPVNPSADEVLGLRCYKNIKDFGDAIDLAVIAVPLPSVLSAAESSIAAGAQALCVVTAGFKETGAEGRELEEKLARLCRSKMVRLLGPNCLGLINARARINASFAGEIPKMGDISLLSQSGAICTAALDLAAARGLGMAKLVSMGNKADLDEADFLSYFASDKDTRVIAGYIESIESGDAFIRAASEASTAKPVVMLKSGTTEVGVKAASSHTGSLAGADIAYAAAFKRAGVVRAETFEELFDFAAAFAMQPLPKGNRVAVITNAGGPGVMAADAIVKAGLKTAELETNTAAALRHRLPKAAGVANPIDVLGDADPSRYLSAAKAALEDESVDAVVVILTPQAMTEPAGVARAIASCSTGDKPILVSFMGGKEVMPGREELVEASLPDYPSPERAVAALRVMYEYASWKSRPPRAVARFPVNRRRAERIIARHVKSGLARVNEVQTKNILRAYDFNVPSGRFAASVEEAVEAAVKVGFPVAMKIVSPDIVHKSDLGGVKTGLGAPEAVRDAFELMFLRIPKLKPNIRLDGVYVEQMCPKGREVILGMSRDPQFGPMLMFGLGGIFVEVMKDVSFHLAPITADEALQMLKGAKSYALLEGARGEAGVDMDALAAAMQRLSQLVTDFPQITELDINPLIVGKSGEDAVAADARIVLSPMERAS